MYSLAELVVWSAFVGRLKIEKSSTQWFVGSDSGQSLHFIKLVIHSECGRVNGWECNYYHEQTNDRTSLEKFNFVRLNVTISSNNNGIHSVGEERESDQMCVSGNKRKIGRGEGRVMEKQLSREAYQTVPINFNIIFRSSFSLRRRVTSAASRHLLFSFPVIFTLQLNFKCINDNIIFNCEVR